jgi:hypothetical protein
MCPLVLADDACELRELASERTACFGVRVEGRLQLLQLQHQIQDLDVLGLGPSRRRNTRQASEKYAPRDHDTATDDSALQQTRPRQTGLGARGARGGCLVKHREGQAPSHIRIPFRSCRKTSPQLPQDVGHVVDNTFLDAFPTAVTLAIGLTSSPLFRTSALICFIGVLLALDTQVDARAQLLLGLAAWIALALALRGLPPLLRAQALVVVVVATCAEVVGSMIWGVYTYRLENLPSFVPPCHGLVYVAGFSLAAWAAPRKDLFVRIALVAVLAWGIAGVTVLPRADVGGAIGAALLAVYLVRGRAPEIYAGVFLVVAWLELYGTAIGTWEWAVTIPGTAVPQGNPPSGVASGYVWFDIVALALAPILIRWGARIRSGWRPLPDSA